MKTVILSGGSGNDSLIRGLKYYYPSMNCKVIVNAYDNGKSTGVCRAVTNTLGVSDIRKNHIRMYKAMHGNRDKNIIEFYDNRYDFTPGNEVAEITEKLNTWGMPQFIPLVERFFATPEAKNYRYTDFNISNIVYAEMYAQSGYEYTNDYFCNKILDIDSFVLLNSFSNAYLKAITNSGYVIEDEGEIVEWCNRDDKIESCLYGTVMNTELNPRAVASIESADLIIISTGTFWSSIYPTLEFGDLYKLINKNTHAKKVWALNCEEDKDSYGVSADEFISHLRKLGLSLDDFTILVNSDACDILRTVNDKDVVCHYSHMGNQNGKHDPNKYAKAVLECYYGFDKFTPEQIVCDFDDTLWPRNTSLKNIGIDNIQLLNRTNMGVIISGNSFSSIKTKLASIYGSDLSDFNIPVWADASSTEYIQGVKTHTIEDCFISKDTLEKVESHINKLFGMTAVSHPDTDLPYIKYKPLGNLERMLFTYLFNNYIRYNINTPELLANITGKSTVDITTSGDNKVKVYKECEFEGMNILYIGDEVDKGNDCNVSKLATKSIHTSGVEETNCILKVLCQ